MRAGDARQDLAWCLDQLHKIELGKSVADMTSQKYSAFEQFFGPAPKFGDFWRFSE